MFSRFFIDRPIFAAVISVFFVLAGLAAMRSLPIAQYPEIAPPVVTVQAVYPGASAEVLEQTVAAPLENAINGVPGHALHGVALDGSGRHGDHGHVRDRHQRRRRDDQRQQPREAGRAAAAARSAAPGRVGRARLLVLPPGAGVLFAGRPLQRPLHLELRDAQRPGRAEAPAGHDQRADLRRQGLRDAHLAPARPPRAVEIDAQRRRQRHQRAERAVRGGQGGPDADRRQAGPRLHDHHARPARRPEGVRTDHRPREPRRLDGAALRRRPRRAGLEGLRLHRPLQRPRSHAGRHLPVARRQRAQRREDGPEPRPPRSRRSFPRA